MFCPKCASQAEEGQRFCRNCGTNLGAIVDAMEGKRTPVDYDALKEDLRQLGSSLRAGFEEAKQGIKKTQQLKRKHRHRQGWNLATLGEMGANVAGPATPVAAIPPIQIKPRRTPSSRRYSLQQAMLSIFGGGASMAVFYQILNTAAGSGLLSSLERIITQEWLHHPEIVGVAPVLQMLWLMGLLPVAKGVAHLLNGIFFAARPSDFSLNYVPAPAFSQTVTGTQAAEQPTIPAAINFSPEPKTTIPTNDLEEQWPADFRPSITEESTVPLQPQKK